MNITKRNNTQQAFNPSKILARLKKQSKGLDVDFTLIAIEVQQQLYEGITTATIDERAAQIAASYTTAHPDYSELASKILVSRLEKELLDVPYLERVSSFITDDVKNKVAKWNVKPDYSANYNLDYFGLITFLKVYAIADKGIPIELPSEMWYRVALATATTKEEFESFYYNSINKLTSDASPILMNAGRTTGALISCSLNTLKDDSREGITETLNDISVMSKDSAGIGLYVGNMRSSQTMYANRGKAGGVVKFAKILNEWIRFFKQNENKKGAIALYQDIWHMDIVDFLNLKSRNGSEETTAKDIFTALSVPDLFWERLAYNETFSLFCPHQVLQKFGIKLYELWGEEFEESYLMLEKSDIDRKEIKANELFSLIGKLQAERGTPYIFNRDNANRRYNLSNLGTIKGLNLCIEFLGYHDKDNSAQCDLGAIVVHNFVKNNKVDYDGITQATKTLTVKLNNIIDINPWSCDSAKRAGTQQRNIGIGIAGLADLAAKLDLSFTSEEFKQINKNVQECIYFAALTQSCELAQKGTFTDVTNTTPIVIKRQLPFDLDSTDTFIPKKDWENLLDDITTHGVANSLLCCNMPTATTSTLLNCNEAFEPFQDLIFTRKTVAGEFTIFNRHLIKDLIKHNCWSDDVRKEIMINESLQNIDLGIDSDIQSHLREKYRTIWEIKQKDLIDMAADRQQFIDQSQSMNLYWAEADLKKISASLFYGWKKGLVTGVYYTKVKPNTKADKSLGVKLMSKEKPDSQFECVGCSA